ncbi:4-oxalocrotonate tautomerase [Pseudoxanthomonas sp. GM95]|uniref:tautomerase family protein n=1 Tax=Pseudoxanthomonas sp. GM95 TaxID=1881043 RepID=UPI0008D0883F|nr:tautomerase family protein [Pseudoxanthomonas sp. GM95]SEM52580.1 4-oxalocrotonate tautomerase [Pseudoxanthomonas sp. GM95]
MPIIHITLVQGRPEEKIQQFIRQVAQVASDTLDAPIQTVRVMVNEVPPTRFAVGDRLKSDPSNN